MESKRYTIAGVCDILYRGSSLKFRDMTVPKPGQDDFGANTLEREMRGPTCGYDEWYDALAQKGEYKDGGITYYLQSFTPIRDKIFPGGNLLFKGLRNGIPTPVVSGRGIELVSTLTCTTPEKATRRIRYNSRQTNYRYITNSVPTGPANNKIDVNITLLPDNLISSEITLENGDVVYGPVNAALLTALTPVGFYDLAILDGYYPIIGTPYYECQDTVTRYLPTLQ